jgi:hypothetical protein
MTERANADEGAADEEKSGSAATIEAVAELPDATTVGRKRGEVELAIDYAIVRHFSEHLYGSPNKAVEELVANGFDAMASVAYVYVPGKLVADKVAVWDDGESMDIAGIQAMWKIARSPKQAESARTRTVGNRERKLIGKFGIGKLASYAVGDRISHLCKHNGDYLLVGIDYREVQEGLGSQDETANGSQDESGSGSDVVALATADGGYDSGNGAGADPVYRTDIRELTEEEAKAWAGAVLPDTVHAWALFEKPNFTLAVIDRLRDDVKLPPGRLGWVLGNAMPLRPDFRVEVDDRKVAPRLGKGATTNWTFAEKRVKDSLETAWQQAKEDGNVDGEPIFEASRTNSEGEKEPAVEFPNLGTISAELSLFPNSLKREDESKDERSHGFFVMVRDRLLNTEDPELYLAPPSYGTFYRMQAVIRADGLDADLLADRERLRGSTRVAELEVLQRAIYRAARGEIERQDERREEAEAPYHLLPTQDRRLFREPLSAVLLQDEGAPAIEKFSFDTPEFEREDLPEDRPVAVIAPDGRGFQINTSHPFFRTLRDEVGTGVKAERAIRAFELLAISERLLEGHLYDVGLSREKVRAILDWRDDLLRQLAVRFRNNPDDVIADAYLQSQKGRKKFEIALAKLFQLMGFIATRKGGSGEEDILVVGPTGPSETRFIVDAKSSKNTLKNDEAEVGPALGHLEGVDGASVVLIVAREFAGFERGDDPAILRDCRQASAGENKVSIVDVPTLESLYKAVHRWSYPLELILPVLQVIERPEEKRKRIEQLENPIEHFDHKELLERIWARQQNEASGDVVPYRFLWQEHYREELDDYEDFKRKLVALETVSGRLIQLGESDTVCLLQSPDMIAQHIQRSLEEQKDVEEE